MSAYNFRVIRGGDDHKVCYYKTEGARNAAGHRYATLDREIVLLESYESETNVWWLDGTAYPPGHPDANKAPNPKRTSVNGVLPGDEVTVFGAAAGTWGTGHGDHHGIIQTMLKPLPLPYTTDTGVRITFTDGRQVDCILGAVATLHKVSDLVDWDDSLRELLDGDS